MTTKIISIWGACPDYNESLSHDGGSYRQPAGGMLCTVAGQDVVVTIDDQSCGDFGSRVFAAVETASHLWRVCFGSMQDACIDSDTEIDAVMASISGVLGIADPWHELICLADDAMETAISISERAA